jgi:hypothetical protein
MKAAKAKTAVVIKMTAAAVSMVRRRMPRGAARVVSRCWRSGSWAIGLTHRDCGGAALRAGGECWRAVSRRVTGSCRPRQWGVLVREAGVGIGVIGAWRALRRE